MVKPQLKKTLVNSTDYDEYTQKTYNFTRGKKKFDIDIDEIQTIVNGMINQFNKKDPKPKRIEVAISGLTKVMYVGLKEFSEPLSILTDEIEIWNYVGGKDTYKIDWTHLSQFNCVFRLFYDD